MSFKKLFPNLLEDLRNVKNAYDSRPKTAWWHKKPAEDSTVRKAERAYADRIYGYAEAKETGTTCRKRHNE